MALIVAPLNAGVILVVALTVYFLKLLFSNKYIISLLPHLHPPSPTLLPSLISLMVSVDVKHHVYLLTYLLLPSKTFHWVAVFCSHTGFPARQEVYYVWPVKVVPVTSGKDLGCPLCETSV